MRIVTHVFAGAGTVEYNIGGQYLRLITTSAPVDVIPLEAGRELSDERATSVEAGFSTRPPAGFDGFRLTSATAQTVRIAVTSGSGSYDRTSGDVSILGTVPVSGPLTDAQLRASAVPVSGAMLTDAQLRATPPEFREVLRYGASYSNETAAGANNTAFQVFAAASNTNGAIVWAAHSETSNSGNPPVLGLIAHTAAPTLITQGDLLCLSDAGAGYSTGSLVGFMALPHPVFIAAGKGLWHYTRWTESFGYRSALYTLLP